MKFEIKKDSKGEIVFILKYFNYITTIEKENNNGKSIRNCTRPNRHT